MRFRCAPCTIDGHNHHLAATLSRERLDVQHSRYRFRDVVLLAFINILISGCVYTSSGNVELVSMNTTPRADRTVTFINETPYITEMTIALSEHGFNVKPMPTVSEITKTMGSDQTERYNKASARWGLRLVNTPTDVVCALTNHRWYNFTLMVIDIRQNENVFFLKQMGPDGPCTTAEPVFSSLASALSEQW